MIWDPGEERVIGSLTLPYHSYDASMYNLNQTFVSKALCLKSKARKLFDCLFFVLRIPFGIYLLDYINKTAGIRTVKSF